MITVVVLHGAGLQWSVIAIFLWGLFVARVLARDMIKGWANLRVWTFRLRPSANFFEQLLQWPLSEEEKRWQEQLKNMAKFAPEVLAKPGVTSERLNKLVIEEYPTRIRAHLWLASPNPHNPELPHLRYDWFDVPSLSSPALWEYSKEAMPGVLKLSVFWGWNTWRPFPQLTLWFDVEREAGKSWEIPVIFRIPLDPSCLSNELDETVYDEGIKRKTTKVELFSDAVELWECECGEGSERRWSWYLHMRTL